jgi:hypothetical protein
MASSGMLRRVALVRTHVSGELSASIIGLTKLGELGTTLTVTSNRRIHAFLRSVRRFLQEPHGVTSQKTPFFIVIAVKTSNRTKSPLFGPCNHYFVVQIVLLSHRYS